MLIIIANCAVLALYDPMDYSDTGPRNTAMADAGESSLAHAQEAALPPVQAAAHAREQHARPPAGMCTACASLARACSPAGSACACTRPARLAVTRTLLRRRGRKARPHSPPQPPSRAATPPRHPTPPAELPFNLIFTVEMLLKITALGFVGRGSYLGDRWNWLDFFIVIIGFVGMIPGVGNFSALRTFRVLRPLRTLSTMP
jgi:hypothetical protein